MQMLRRALALDPNYDAAMAYMNLLYRLRAARADQSAVAAGFIDAVMHPGSDRLTRVLAGPYFDEAAAHKVKAGLEAAGFKVLRKWE